MKRNECFVLNLNLLISESRSDCCCGSVTQVSEVQKEKKKKTIIPSCFGALKKNRVDDEWF